MPRTQEEIENKIQSLNEEVNALFEEADTHITEEIKGQISFCYEISAPRDVFTPYERAQSLCFVTKYDSLPDPVPIDIREHNGRFYPNNIDTFRHLLNEYRPIIQNNSDSTYFSKVHFLCRQKLENDDPSSDLSIKVQDDKGEYITKSFLRLLVIFPRYFGHPVKLGC